MNTTLKFPVLKSRYFLEYNTETSLQKAGIFFLNLDFVSDLSFLTF